MTRRRALGDFEDAEDPTSRSVKVCVISDEPDVGEAPNLEGELMFVDVRVGVFGVDGAIIVGKLLLNVQSFQFGNYVSRSWTVHDIMHECEQWISYRQQNLQVL